MTKHIKVVELFAGVGGFRIGLEGWQRRSATSGYKKLMPKNYQVIWSNQWEPSEKSQSASKIYCQSFGEKGHSNKDIATVPINEIPHCDMLVAGFPCQDYSVARKLKGAQGIKGNKGKMWWEIERILNGKIKAGQPIKYLLLENVDRLLRSPSTNRGHDFAVILRSLQKLGYGVEWRVINAADYGFPQKRKRVFIMGYYQSTPQYRNINTSDETQWLSKNGTLARAFPAKMKGADFHSFSLNNNVLPFENAGLMIKGNVYTVGIRPQYKGTSCTLGNVLEKPEDVPVQFTIAPDSLSRWKYLKGAKHEPRLHKDTGNKYYYVEGAMPFPDDIDRPARTIVTSEGGTSPSRTKHVIELKTGGYRRLAPIELERLNMFPDNFTIGVSDQKRAFLMGNALVIGVVERIGLAFNKLINAA